MGFRRTRRNRRTARIRDLTRETWLQPQNLILPVFIADPDDSVPATGSDGPWKVSPLKKDQLLKTCESAVEVGVHSLLLLPCVSVKKKCSHASEALNSSSHYLDAIRSAKKAFPDLTIISDIALGPYTQDGHDGIFRNGKCDEAETLKIFSDMTVLQAEAGSDYLGPSDMMDGRVKTIRSTLDDGGFVETGIMSYVKFASSLYAPFRSLIRSQLKEDKRGYQIDPSNSRDAMSEARQDLEEGADCLIVKPATSYLDIIYRLSTETDAPIIAYHVSGESAMIDSAAHFGYLDKKLASLEICSSIRRAGASAIITYSALDIARALQE
ncbi:MAG: porphobilinogen synthase [Bdellovibrionales bacterium]|nr:porphobilinogen synthase [Bdellovibrionales bacterium]